MFRKSIMAFATTGAVFFTLLSPVAHAGFFWEKKEEVHERSTYISGAYGSFDTEGDNIDDDDRYHELGLGVKLSKHFGVEAVYSDFGSVQGDLVSADFSGVSANIVGYFPMNEYASLYLKGGFFFANFDLRLSGEKISYKDEQPTISIGAAVRVSDPFTVFAEFSHYAMDLEDADTPSVFEQQDIEVQALKVGARFMF